MTTIFVFGSNLAGRHGKGAALHAKKYYGAVYGRGMGLQGNSYAIPTKDVNLHTLPLERIKYHVEGFIKFAKMQWLKKSDMQFVVTAIGCGLAGYTPRQIAPMFISLKDFDNVILPMEFKMIIEEL